MNNPEYKYRCTKPLCSDVCMGYADGFCISIENCAYKQKRKTNFENVTKSINDLANFISEITESCERKTECRQSCGGCDEEYCSVDKAIKWLESEAINE